MRLKLQLLATFVILSAAVSPALAALDDTPARPVALARGDQPARFYAPEAKGGPPRALIVFGSGDGGWSYWEERVCRRLAEKGCAVAGIDFNAYAATDFTPDILRRDYRVLVEELRRRHPDAGPVPVLYGGWSMGAEQSLPASSETAARAEGLRGLILVAPGARGRYGLRLRDRMGMAPAGPDTFSLRELAPRCSDLRFAVFHAGLDLLDDLKWSEGLALERKLWVLPRTFHDFAGAGDAFLAQLDEALPWLLREEPARSARKPE